MSLNPKEDTSYNVGDFNLLYFFEGGSIEVFRDYFELLFPLDEAAIYIDLANLADMVRFFN